MFDQSRELFCFCRNLIPLEKRRKNIEYDAERIMETAASYIGTKAIPPELCEVVFNEHYYGKKVSGPEYAWCVVFIWDIFRMCGLSEYFYDGKKTDECDDVARWAKENGLLVPVSEGRYGDIVIYSWEGKTLDHIGLIEQNNGDGTYTVIEGNTAPDLVSPMRAVLRMNRTREYIACIVRPGTNFSSRYSKMASVVL